MPLFDRQALAGKRILVTGGGSGLGRGVAAEFAAHGADVHLWGRRQGVLEEAAGEINGAEGGQAHVQAVDVRQADQVDAAAEEIWENHGSLTGLVNNAGANFIVPTRDLSPRGFEAVTSTIMTGSFNATHACGKRWIAAERPGAVVSMLTTWIWTGSPFVTASAMAKSAVHAMTMSLAVEWARHGIRVNAVAPGPFPTEYAWEMLNPTGESSAGATQADEVPMGRFGDIKELANLLILLLSDACDYITGETIAIDGGHHLAAPSTFAGMTKLTDQDWAEIRRKSEAASAASKAQRTV